MSVHLGTSMHVTSVVQHVWKHSYTNGWAALTSVANISLHNHVYNANVPPHVSSKNTGCDFSTLFHDIVRTSAADPDHTIRAWFRSSSSRMDANTSRSMQNAAGLQHALDWQLKQLTLPDGLHHGLAKHHCSGLLLLAESYRDTCCIWAFTASKYM
jgi:hypothetical protein